MAESKPKTIEQVRRNYRIVVAIAFSYIVVLEILHSRLEASFDDLYAQLETTTDKLGQEVVRRDPYVDVNFTNADNDGYFENFQVVVLDDFDYYPDVIYGFGDEDDDGIVEHEAFRLEYGPNVEKTVMFDLFNGSRLRFAIANRFERMGLIMEDKDFDGTIDFLMQNQTKTIFYQDSWHEVLNRVDPEQESFIINTPDGEIELVFGENGWEEK